MPTSQTLWMLVTVVTTLFGCAASKTPEPVGGETHFLHACDGADSCGVGLDCVCGVCTETCLTDNSCKDQSVLATCEAAGTPRGACDNPQASPVCDVTCDVDADCTTLGATYTCESGSCRKLDAGSCVAGGVIYADNATFIIDCNGCTCSDGTVTCGDLCGGLDGGRGDSGMDATVEGGVIAQLIDPTCVMDDDAGMSGTNGLTLLDVEDVNPALPTGAEIVAIGPAGFSFDVVGNGLYWLVAGGSEQIVRAEIQGTRIWTFGVQALESMALAVDECRVYWSDTPPGQFRFRSVRHDGLEPRLLTDFMIGDQPEVIVPDATHLYAATGTRLLRVSKLGGEVEVLRTRTRTTPPRRDLIVLSDRVLWLEQDGSQITLDGTIVSIPKGNPQAATTIVTGLANPTAMVTDGAFIYVSNNGRATGGVNAESASVMRVSLSGGEPEVLWLETYPMPLIAVDSGYVYYSVSTPLGMELYKLPKANPSEALRITDNAISFMTHGGYVYWSGGAFIARQPGDAWL